MNKKAYVRKIRAVEGYALIATLLLGTFSIIFLLALGGSLIATSRAGGVTQSKRLLDEAAEIGLDYAIQNMNNAHASGTSSIFDIANGTMETVQTLPSSYYSNLVPEATVKIRVRKLSNEELLAIKDFSTLYDKAYGPDSGGAGQSSPQNLLRVAEITASNGLFSRSLRAIIEPHTPPSEDPETGDEDETLPRTGLFPSVGMFGNSNLSLIGNVTAQIHPSSTPLQPGWPVGRGYDSPDNPATTEVDPSRNYRLDLQTNNFAELSGGAKIVGNLKISNSTTDAPPVVGTADQGSQIFGRAYLTNSTDPLQTAALQGTAGDTPNALDEVLAQAERDPNIGGVYNANRVGFNKSAPVSTVTSQADLKQFIIPPVPSDSSAIDPYTGVGTTSGSTRWEYVYPEGTSGLPEQSSFRVNALQLTNDNTSATKLSFLPLANAPPAKVYIDSGTVLDTDGTPLPALNIDTNMFTINSSNPLALQIFYAGTQDIKINVTNGGASGIGRFDGLIFAPNAKVIITGKGIFNGNVVADDLRVLAPSGNLTLNLVTDLNNYSAPSAFATPSLLPPSYQPAPEEDEGVGVIDGYNPVTHQKLNGKLVE